MESPDAAFTRTAAALVAANDRIPAQRGPTPPEQAPADGTWEHDGPRSSTEWGLVVKESGKAALGLDEEVARFAAKGRDDLALVSREVTPWRSHEPPGGAARPGHNAQEPPEGGS